MKAKTKLKKAAGRIVAAGLTFCLAAGSFAYAADSSDVNMISIDSSILKATGHRAAQVCVEILGADLVATSNMGASGDLSGANAQAFMKIFGSNVNESPDPYLYNFYESYKEDDTQASLTAGDKNMLAYNTLYFDAQGNSVAVTNPNGADTKIAKTPTDLGTSCSLYMRGDVLVGGDKSAYTSLLADLDENKDEDTANDYDPAVVAYGMGGIINQCASLKTIAEAFEGEMKDSNGNFIKTTRYMNADKTEGTPTQIAAAYQEFAEGVYYYVQSKIASGQITKKKVVVITGGSDESGWTVSGNASLTANNGTRIAQYLYGNTTNIADSYLGTATSGTMTTSAIASAAPDFIFATGTDVSALKNVLGDNVKVFTDLPVCVYGMVMNTHENIWGIPYIMSYVYYDQDNSLNPAYMTTYFLKQIYHVKNEAIISTVNDLLTSASKPAGFSLTDFVNNNSKTTVPNVITAVQSVISSGIDYANANNKSWANILAGTEQ